MIHSFPTTPMLFPTLVSMIRHLRLRSSASRCLPDLYRESQTDQLYSKNISFFSLPTQPSERLIPVCKIYEVVKEKECEKERDGEKGNFCKPHLWEDSSRPVVIMSFNIDPRRSFAMPASVSSMDSLFDFNKLWTYAWPTLRRYIWIFLSNSETD